MSWVTSRGARFAILLLLPAVLAVPSPAHAEIVLSQLVVDLGSGQDRKADIEIWNNSDERAYVAAEPSEIVNAGKPGETRRAESDPEKRGILVAPGRMILEPGQRRLIRLAPIGLRGNVERVYRVTVKPVAGTLSSEETGLKLLIGYDVLVLLRPSAISPALVATRSGKRLTVRNDGNASVELIDGRQCATKTTCIELPSKRLYAGAEWTQDLPSDAPADYVVVSQGQSQRKRF